MRTVYIWDNGAFVSTLDSEFVCHYQELCNQFGEPDRIEEREEDK